MLTIQSLRDALVQGHYDEMLTKLYNRRDAELAPYRERMLRAADGYLTTFGKGERDAFALYSAPGRTEIGGNHTDHQRGKVMAGSVDLDAIACAAPNGTNTVNVFSEGYGMLKLTLDDLTVRSSAFGTTKALIRGIIQGVREQGYEVGGFDAYVISDVPGGSGLSSSACFEVLIGTAVNGMFAGNQLDMQTIAKIGQMAESKYFGKPCGLLDQMGCALGGIVSIDFKQQDKPVIKSIAYDFTAVGYVLCIIDTGANHAGLTADYAAVPAEMKAIAAELGKTVLSEVEESSFYASIPALRKAVGDRAVLRAMHYYDDCRHVEEQSAALEAGVVDRFLSLVNASGASSFTKLQNISTYRDPADQPVAVALALAKHLLNGQGAVRVHGGGFAGTIQAYVPADMVSWFASGMDEVFGAGACRVTFIRPIGGCCMAE